MRTNIRGSIILRKRTFSDKSSRENQNTCFMLNNYFRQSCPLWDNEEKILYSRRGHKWQHGVCSISKAINTHAQYVILVTFPLQKWLHERASMLRFIRTSPVMWPLWRAGATTYSNILQFLFTSILTPWCRFLLEKLTGLQLVKKFPAFHGTWRFITAITSVLHLSLSWASPIQSIYPHPTSWISILILSTHLRLGLPSGLLPSGFPSKTLYTPSPHPYVPHAQPI